MTAWGRDPRAGHWIAGGPRSTAAAVLLSLATVAGGAQVTYARWTTPQQFYFGDYVRSVINTQLAFGPREYTVLTGAKGVQTARFENAAIRHYLREAVYGETILRLFLWPLLAGVTVLLVLLPLGIRQDIRRRKDRRQGRHLRGTRRVDAATFRRELGGDGIAFPQQRGPAVVIPRKMEQSHILIASDTGTGKSQLNEHILDQVAARGETAVCYDVAREFVTKHYRPERGDIILDPEDRRGAYWPLGDEVLSDTEALTLATSMIPRKENETNSFFTDSARTILGFLLTFRPTTQQLIDWLTDQAVLGRMVAKSIYADILPANAPAQRAGVLAPLKIAAESLMLCPPESECAGRWTAAAWAKTRQGWVFILSRPMTRERLRPLHTLWLDMIILRLMVHHATPKVWLILDEVDTLNKLWQLQTGVTEGRKYNLALVLAMQGFAQLQARYGRAAETMLSQPATTIYLRSKLGGEWASKAIGEEETERLRQSKHDAWFMANDKTSYQMDRERIPLVLSSEISGLEDLKGYIKIRDLVCPMDIKPVTRPERHPAFVARPPVPARVQPKTQTTHHSHVTFPTVVTPDASPRID
jgi:Type IV secretion-system coupling protein DNA-binding domain